MLFSQYRQKMGRVDEDLVRGICRMAGLWSLYRDYQGAVLPLYDILLFESSISRFYGFGVVVTGAAVRVCC